MSRGGGFGGARARLESRVTACEQFSSTPLKAPSLARMGRSVAWTEAYSSLPEPLKRLLVSYRPLAHAGINKGPTRARVHNSWTRLRFQVL